MARTSTRPGIISSAALRKTYDLQADNPLFQQAFAAVDEAQRAFDGLLAVRNSPSPLKTREAHALELRHKVQKTVENIAAKLEGRSRALFSAMEDRQRAAYQAAGVVENLPGGEEVRRALREMSQRERDAALSDAIKRKDRVVLSAIHGAPSPVTVGNFSSPFYDVLEQYVRDENPGYADDIAAMAGAIQHVDIISDAFASGADGLRDKAAEEAAEAGHAAAESANKQLIGAMGVNPFTQG